MPRATQTWPGIAADVSEARRFVSQTLASWGADEFEWPAAALVSELATNAVLHTGTSFAVTLTLVDDRLRLEVADGSPTRPVLRNYADDATTGRGLRLLVQLSEQWGVEPKQASKSVWCVLSVSADKVPESPDLDDESDVEALLGRFDGDHAADRATEAGARSAAWGEPVAA